MKTDPRLVPHFLRFTQAVARVSGIGLPSAALLVAAACGGRTQSTTGGDAGRHDASGFSVNDGAPLGVNCNGPPVDSGPCAELGTDVDSSLQDATLGKGVDDGGSDVFIGNDTAPPPDDAAPVVDAGIQEAPDSGIPTDAETDAPLDTGGLLLGVDGSFGAKDAASSDGESRADGPDEASLTGGGPAEFPDLPA